MRPFRSRSRISTQRKRRLIVEQLEARLALDAEPLNVVGTPGPDVIVIDASGPDMVTVTLNGTATGPFKPLGPIDVQGLGGDDQILVRDWVQLPTRIDGGAGRDVIRGGSGDDFFLVRDGEADGIDGGLGIDRAHTDSHDSYQNIEHLNPIPVTADNQQQRVKVLVLNFDPLVPSEGNRRLYEIFGWSNPHNLAAGYEADLERASGGTIEFEIVEWRNINEIPAFVSGFRYTPDQYVQNRRTNTGWQTGPADWPRIVREQNIVPLVDSGQVDEVWLFGDHYFELLGESFMSGPGAFFVNGPTFPQIPTQRAFVSYGFSYERGVAEMLHNTGHRTEATLGRTFGDWQLANPTSNWGRFSANYTQSNGVAGVGTTHWPANAEGDYDTDNLRFVQSWADDYLNYPNLTFATEPVNRESWDNYGGDFERGYQNWYFAHLPRAAGVNPDGTQNNWWKYLYDFNNYTPAGQPKPLSAAARVHDIFNPGGGTHDITVAYSGAVAVDITALDGSDLRVTGPGGFNVPAQLVGLSDTASDTYVVATYRIAAPGGTWDAADFGEYRVHLEPSQVRNVAGTFLPASQIGGFNVRSATSVSQLANDADTSLLLRFEGSATGAGGETASGNPPATYEAGRIGQAAHFGAGEYATYPIAGNVNPLAGTVEFWIKPDWPGNDAPSHTIFSAGSGLNNAIHIYTDGWHPGFKVVMCGDDPATPGIETNYESNRYQAALTNTWQAGQWHHVAATWDSQAQFIRIYFDGQLVADWAGCPVISAFSTSSFSIGANQAGGTPSLAALDELRISTRARTSSEIRAAYNAGWAAAGLALNATTVTVPLGATRTLMATAEDASGAARDVSPLVAWSSSDPAVASVSSTGVVTALASGNAIITATLDGLTADATVNVPAVLPPRGAFMAADVMTRGQSWYYVDVTYTDELGVNLSSLGLGDLRVENERGFSAFLRLVGMPAGGNGTPRTARYEFTPPGGYWDDSDNGVYTVTLQPGQVLDTDANLNAQVFADTFVVAVAPLNQSPTVATPAAAMPNPVTGATAALSVLGADDAGEAGLTYTWTVTDRPAGAADPQFSASGTNAAKNATASFFQSGSYRFRVDIVDAEGASTSSTVAVVVEATLTSISVTPQSVALNAGANQQYAATARDQFGSPLAAQPAFSWDVASGGGSITAAGLFTAPATLGPFTVRATSGTVAGTADGSVINSGPTIVTPAAASQNPVQGLTTTLSVAASDNGGEAGLVYTWSILNKPLGAADPSFSPNGSNLAKSSTATFTHSGTYRLRVTVHDGVLSTTSDLDVAVDVAPAQNDVEPFDVNGDGIVNLFDLIDLISVIVDRGMGPAPIPQPTDNPQLHSDVNGDRMLDTFDLVDMIGRLVSPPPAVPAAPAEANATATDAGNEGDLAGEALIDLLAADTASRRRRRE